MPNEHKELLQLTVAPLFIVKLPGPEIRRFWLLNDLLVETTQVVVSDPLSQRLNWEMFTTVPPPGVVSHASGVPSESASALFQPLVQLSEASKTPSPSLSAGSSLSQTPSPSESTEPAPPLIEHITLQSFPVKPSKHVHVPSPSH